MRNISIHQPSYWPWLGYLDKISKSNIFVFLDNVQANKASYQFRNIFWCNGQEKFITLPVNYSHGILLNQLEFKNDKWIKDHLNKLRNYYLKATYFKEVYDKLIQLYQSFHGRTPIEVLYEITKQTFDWFGIKVELLLASDLEAIGKKGELVLNICKELNADLYISGMGGKSYMDANLLEEFEKGNIMIEWNSFEHPEYSQHPKYNFVGGLSCLDYLFWNGFEAAINLFKAKL